MAATVNSEPIDLTDVSNMSLTKLIRQKEEIEMEVENLCNLMYLLNKARLKYESSVEYVNKLHSVTEESNVLIPLSSSMFIPGDLCKVNKVMVNLGGEYHAEMDRNSAINHFIRKIQKIKAKISVTQKVLATKILERERLRKAAAEKYFEEKKKRELKPLPTLLTG